MRRYSCLLVGAAALVSQPWTAWAQAVGPDLTIAMSHRGNFTVGVNGVYTIVVSNIGGTASSGLITVIDSLPLNFDFVSATGTGWSCRVTSCLICPNPRYTVHCDNSSVIAPGGSAFPITLTVRPYVSGTVTNEADVSGGGDTVLTNNFATDPTLVVAAVPTLPEWAMIALSALLVWACFAARRPPTDVSDMLTW